MLRLLTPRDVNHWGGRVQPRDLGTRPLSLEDTRAIPWPASKINDPTNKSYRDCRDEITTRSRALVGEFQVLVGIPSRHIITDYDHRLPRTLHNSAETASNLQGQPDCWIEGPVPRPTQRHCKHNRRRDPRKSRRRPAEAPARAGLRRYHLFAASVRDGPPYWQ